MSEFANGIVSLLKDKKYWNGIFIIWVCSFFILPNATSVRLLFYCFIALPALFLISQIELSQIKIYQYKKIGLQKSLLVLMIILLLASSLHHDLIKQIKYVGVLILFYFSVSRMDVSNLKDVWRVAWFFLAITFAYILINMLLKSQSFDGNNILKKANETWLIFHLPLAIILAAYFEGL